MGIISIIIGAVLIVAAIVSLIVSIARTPDHLQGYYGVMYVVLTVIGIIGGAGLIVFGIF